MLQANDFTQQPAVVACLAQLKTRFGNEYGQLLVSDTLDQDGHQYVNLVQKGGGVLGVTLVGYTYVLEMVGIRFLKLAGTSAGAINTALLAAVGDAANPKGSFKSNIVLDHLGKLDFFSLVDGHPFARWAIRKLLTTTQSVARAKRYVIASSLGLVLLLGLDVLLLGLQHRVEWARPLAQMLFVLSGIALTAVFGVIFYGQYLLRRLQARGYGINPGNFFYDWIDGMFKQNGINSVTDLRAKVAAPVLGLRVRRPESQDTDMLTGEVTFIASEIVSKNKVEFPKMCGLFSANPDALAPARFVRASMAIPLFFESHLITGIPQNDPDVQAAWKEFFGVEPAHIPTTARLVDGGVLSNFPISVFYNPKVWAPRLPVFGIDLDDSPSADKPRPGAGPPDVAAWKLREYFSHLLDTLRGYYDKEFLLKNSMFQRGIGKVLLPEFNWLNFFLTDKEKLAMFVKGAQAAQAFLEEFNWPEYQQARVELNKDLLQKTLPS